MDKLDPKEHTVYPHKRPVCSCAILILPTMTPLNYKMSSVIVITVWASPKHVVAWWGATSANVHRLCDSHFNRNTILNLFFCQTLFPNPLCCVFTPHFLPITLLFMSFQYSLPLSLYSIYSASQFFTSFPSSLTSFFSVFFHLTMTVSFLIHLLLRADLPSPFIVPLLRPRRSFAVSWKRRRRPVCTASWETYWGTISTTTGRGSCQTDAAPEPCAPKPCCTSAPRSSSSARTALSSRSKSTPCRYGHSTDI